MKTKRFFLRLLSFALAVILGGGILLPAFSVTASAAETVDLSTSDPLDDLTGATVLGNKFDPANYPFKEDGEAQFLIMLESGFSARSGLKSDLELYFYFYNPQATPWTDSSLNTVKLQYGENGETVVLPLEIVSASKGTGYERLFYKMKVDFSASSVSRAKIWEALTAANKPRSYNIVSVNLYTNGALDLITIGNKFVFKGYMKGYGYVASDETSLECSSGASEVITVDVGTTYYRADALNNAQEQLDDPTKPLIDAVDSLHSVYVAIPDAMIEKYGKVTKFTGRYIDAKTVPMLIVGDEEIYNSVKGYVGKYVGADHYEGLDYRFYSDLKQYSMPGTALINTCGYAYHYYTTASVFVPAKRVDTLQVLFSPEEFGINAADAKFLVSGTDVQRYFATNIGASESVYTSPSGKVYGEKYFETLPRESDGSYKYTLFDVTDTSVLDLTGDVITETFWSTLFPGLARPEVSEFYDKDISALYKVTDADFDVAASTREEKIQKICDKLLIAERDYDEFEAYYDEAKREKETVYLLRYRISNYYAEECSIFNGGWFGQDGGATDFIENTNAVFIQMHVDLGFELLDVTFTADDGVVTVIPIAMAPIDVFHDITGAVNTTSDEWRESFELFTCLILIVVLILGIIALFSAFPALTSVVRMVVSGIAALWRLVTFPFRWLGRWLFGKK